MSKLLVYSILITVLLLCSQVVPSLVDVRRDTCAVVALVLTLSIIILDTARRACSTVDESFSQDVVFERAESLYQDIKDLPEIDLKTYAGGFLEDKYKILQEAHKTSTKPEDVKAYFVKHYKTSQDEGKVWSASENEAPPLPEAPVVEKEQPQEKTPVSRDEIRQIIREVVMHERHTDFLEKPEYAQKNPLYYTNKGDLIDRSWENQFTVLDTKHWRPYVSPPPLCVGTNEACQACPTVMHSPYLELKNFDHARKVVQ